MRWPEKLVLVPFALVSAYLVFLGSLGNPEFGKPAWFDAWLSIEATIFMKVFFPLWIVVRVIALLAVRR